MTPGEMDLLSLAEIWRSDYYRGALAACALRRHPSSAGDLHLFLPAPANPFCRPPDWLWLRGEVDAWARRALA